MRPWFAVVIAVAFGCGSSGSGSGADAGGGGNGDSGDDGDGGQIGPRTVTLTLTGRPTNATMFSFLVAYQDGANAWQLAPAPTGDTYSFTINAPSYGVMYACIGNTPGSNGATQTRSVTAAHFAVGERTSVTLDVPARCSDRNQGMVTLSGSVTNRPSGGVLVVQYGTRTAFVGQQTGNFSLQVPTGTRDLILSHAVPEGNGDFFIDEAVVVRDVAVSANTTKSIDFATALPTEYFYVDTSDAPLNARVVATTTLYTANGTTASLVREAQDWESDALEGTQRRATDVYDQAIAVNTLGGGATVTHAASQPEDQTYESPDPLGEVMTTIPTKTPYITLETAWGEYAGAVGYAWAATQQTSCTGQAACTISWSAYLSPGVVGSMPAYRMPDLSALAGWKDAFELVSSPLTGSVTAVTSSAGAADFPTGIPKDGTDRVFVRTDYGVSP